MSSTNNSTTHKPTAFTLEMLHATEKLSYEIFRLLGTPTYLGLSCKVKYAGLLDEVGANRVGIVAIKHEDGIISFHGNHHQMDTTSFLWRVRGCLDPRRVVPHWPAELVDDTIPNRDGYLLSLKRSDIDRSYDTKHATRKVCYYEAMTKKIQEIGYDGLLVIQDMRHLYGLGPSHSGNCFREVYYDGRDGKTLSEILAEPTKDTTQLPGVGKRTITITDWDRCLRLSDMYGRVSSFRYELPTPEGSTPFTEEIVLTGYTNIHDDFIIQFYGDVAQQKVVVEKIAELGGTVVTP